LSTAVQGVLAQGSFCAVATMTPDGPHCTPLVFAASGGRLWLTTSRRSVKARTWKTDPAISGLVRHDDLAVTFTGTVKTYDALDSRTWGGAVAGATSIARATATFSRKNARFFAGYAVDAKQVPLAWTPPGRVFVGVDLERTALLDDDGVQEGRGRWGGEPASRPTFRRAKGDEPLRDLPEDVATPLGVEGRGALSVVGERGPVVLPVGWRVEGDTLYAALPVETLALAGAAEPVAPMALTIDSASEWRARDMVGAMLQGEGTAFVDGAVGSGAVTMRDLAASIAPGATALVRIAVRRSVWWKGWSSGSARR
jgi:nitroimidazol reductase NimA-like FMN-containing flavoprotein (pyridoxamine 5'-phosphate oxidase superfamily)